MSRPVVVHVQRKPFPQQVSIERVFERVRTALFDRYDVRVAVSSYPSKGLLPRLRAVREGRRLQGDVTHITGDIHYVDLLMRRQSTILTIHDTEFLDRKGWAKRLLYTWIWLRLPVWRAGVVTVPSAAAQRSVLDAVHCKPDKVRVIGNPVGDQFVASPETAAGRPMVLLIGTWPSKNLQRCAEALRGIDARVVLIGSPTSQQYQAFSAAEVELETRVDLTEEQMLAAYQEATVLLFPSLHEGFGVPIIEAQAVGRAVVTSNRPPMRDVAGEGACLVDPLDVASIRAGLERVLGDRDYRKELVEAGRRNVASYQATAVAAQYAALYDAILAVRGEDQPATRE